jgi:hypothetical protein
MDLEEILQKLKNDPEYQERMRIQEDVRLKQVRILREAEKPLLEALRSVGVEIYSIYNFAKSGKPNIAVPPILLEHFKRPYPDEIREGIARALARREAAVFWAEISDLYKKEPFSGAKDGLAVALSGIASPKRLPDLIELILNRENGPSRIFFTRNLSRSKDRAALKTLIELKEDPDLKPEILRILKRKKAA